MTEVLSPALAVLSASAQTSIVKEAENTTKNKGEVVYRVLSLALAFCLLMVEAIDGSGFVPLRIIDGVYLFPLMLIWFPNAFSGLTTGRSTSKYVRIFGWILLVVVPTWFCALKWIVS